jgi:hypothetical protein
MFTGEKSEVNHLRIFGCLVYVHVPKDKRSKLDPSGKKGIFVGYSETSKAYIVYIPGHHILRLAEMSPLMRMQLSVDRDKIIQMRSMMRNLKLPELQIQM